MTHPQAFLLGALACAAILVDLTLWFGIDTTRLVLREAMGGMVGSVALVVGPEAVTRVWRLL